MDWIKPFISEFLDSLKQIFFVSFSQKCQDEVTNRTVKFLLKFGISGNVKYLSKIHTTWLKLYNFLVSFWFQRIRQNYLARVIFGMTHGKWLTVSEICTVNIDLNTSYWRLMGIIIVELSFWWYTISHSMSYV